MCDGLLTFLIIILPHMEISPLIALPINRMVSIREKPLPKRITIQFGIYLDQCL